MWSRMLPQDLCSRLCDPLPQNYQVDWEAILARSPEPFIQSVSPWLYPPAARETPLQSSPSGQGLTADSARIEDPLADMSAPSVDGSGNGSTAGVSKAAPPDTGLQMHQSLLATACTKLLVAPMCLFQFCNSTVLFSSTGMLCDGTDKKACLPAVFLLPASAVAEQHCRARWKVTCLCAAVTDKLLKLSKAKRRPSDLSLLGSCFLWHMWLLQTATQDQVPAQYKQLPSIAFRLVSLCVCPQCMATYLVCLICQHQLLCPRELNNREHGSLQVLMKQELQSVREAAAALQTSRQA